MNLKPLRYAALVAATALLTACGGGMIKADKPLAMEAGKAKVVFMRNSFVNGALDAVVFRMDGKPELLGFSTNGTRVETLVEPGHHAFMVTTAIAGFPTGSPMEGDFAADKTYYVAVTPNWGLGRFFLHPVMQRADAKFPIGSAEVDKLMRTTKPVLLSPKAIAAIEGKEKFDPAKGEARLAEWRATPDPDREHVIVTPGDGI